jgi:Lar family restriction alleviation protein
MSDRDTKLKPCPFCGNEPTIIVRKGKDGWRDRYSVLCDYEHGGCGAESGWYHYEAEAVASWNKRVPITEKELVEYIEKTRKENMELVAKLKRKYEVES